MKKILFALLTLALFSCEKSLAPETTFENASDFEMRVTTASELPEARPAQPGENMKVYRFESDLGFWLIDDNTGIGAWVNIDVPEACSGNRVRDFVDVQQILLNEKDGTPRSIVLMKGEDVKVTVFSYGGNDCTLLLEDAPLFEGRGDFLFRDNDFSPDGPNKNSYGLTVKGDGVSINWHGVFDPGTGIVKQKTSIRLKE